MKELVEIALALLVVLGVIAVFSYGLVYFLSAYVRVFSWVGELPYLRQNRRILRRVEELKASGFAPSLQYVQKGKGVVIDGPGRRIFLANDKAMKLYSIEDVIKVETDFKMDQCHPYTAIRITVRYLQRPLFEIQAIGKDISKLREIDSLLSVMREPSQASGNSAPR